MKISIVDSGVSLHGSTVHAETIFEKDGEQVEKTRQILMDLYERCGVWDLRINPDLHELFDGRDPDDIPITLEDVLKIGKVFDEMFPSKKSNIYRAFRYLFFIAYSEPAAAGKFMSETLGKRLDEIDIPECNIQSDYKAEGERKSDG